MPGFNSMVPKYFNPNRSAKTPARMAPTGPGTLPHSEITPAARPCTGLSM
jgi:hypothetical protein